MRRAIGITLVMISIPYAAYAAVTKNLWPHPPLFHVVMVIFFALTYAVFDAAEERRARTKKMKRLSLENIFRSLIRRRKRQEAKTERQNHRDVVMPPPRFSDVPAPEQGTVPDLEMPSDLRWRKPRIPFYPKLGTLDFPLGAEDADEELVEDVAAAKPMKGEWSAGQPLLPPKPKGRPKNVAVPKSDVWDGHPGLPLTTDVRTPEDEPND